MEVGYLLSKERLKQFYLKAEKTKIKPWDAKGVK